MKRVTLLVSLLLAIAPWTGTVPAYSQPAPAPSSQEFAERAASASQFAIAASELALKRSVDRKVRRFAEQVIEDYRAGSIYISEAAASNKLRLPDRLDASLQSRLVRLENALPAEIDALFMSEMSLMHRDAIPIFAAYAQSGEVRSLRFLAGRALPTLRENYASVQQLVASR